MNERDQLCKHRTFLNKYEICMGPFIFLVSSTEKIIIFNGDVWRVVEISNYSTRINYFGGKIIPMDPLSLISDNNHFQKKKKNLKPNTLDHSPGTDNNQPTNQK